jgi:hypothetical protein
MGEQRRDMTRPDCRHEWQCDGWTVDPRTSTCRICDRAFVFWSLLDDPTSWKTSEPEVGSWEPPEVPSANR